MDEYLELMGSLIRQAAIDYDYAVKHGYIVGKKVVRRNVNQWLYTPDTLTTAVSFWFKGGLEELCSALQADPDLIRAKFKIFEHV